MTIKLGNKPLAITKSILLLSLFAVSSQGLAATIGAGFGRAAEFSGSSDYAIIPMASLEVETPIGILKNDGIGLALDIVKSGSFDTGPIIRLNPGRDDSVSDPLVAALPTVDASAEAGWFVGSGFPLKALGFDSNAIVIGRLSAVTDVGDGHGGSTVSGSVGLVTPINEKLRIIPSLSFNYGDDEYTNSFFGVASANASADGLAEFKPTGGVESSQVNLVVIRTINQKWSVTGIAAYSFLQGDAAKSPITKRGSDKNLFTGFTANYTF